MHLCTFEIILNFSSKLKTFVYEYTLIVHMLQICWPVFIFGCCFGNTIKKLLSSLQITWFQNYRQMRARRKWNFCSPSTLGRYYSDHSFEQRIQYIKSQISIRISVCSFKRLVSIFGNIISFGALNAMTIESTDILLHTVKIGIIVCYIIQVAWMIRGLSFPTRNNSP